MGYGCVVSSILGISIRNGIALEELMLCAMIFAFAMENRSINLKLIYRDSAVVMLKRKDNQR